MPNLRPDAQRLPVVGPRGLQAQHRLGDDQTDVVLQSVLQPSPPVLAFVAGLRLRVNPYLAVLDAHREAAHVVGEGVEGAAAGQVEAGVMPVAGQDAVADAAPVKGKAHVRTSVVNRVDLALVVEHGNGVAAAGDHHATPLLEPFQRACADSPFH